MTRRIPLFASVLLPACLACSPAGEGLRATPPGTGARVVFDLSATPLPEIPLPNNTATRLDPSSPTGRRINIAQQATTAAEIKVRRKADDMDGFGVFSPLSVKFDAPIDLANLRDRQAKNHAVGDDAVLLVDVTPGSPDFGKTTPLDMGQGNYPLALEWPWEYWDNDEHRDSGNLMFETHDEDTNGNGVLDPYEDIDFDGVLDRPNTWSGKDNGTRDPDDLITFYERETNTLILWPVAPLRQRTTYAVVVTRNLTDANGEPVRSPFPYVNALDQTPDLEPLHEVLPALGFSVDDVQFAWTFTTQSITTDLETVRAGLYGVGPLAALKDEFAPDLETRVVRDPDESGKMPDAPYVVPSEMLQPLIDLMGPVLTYKPATVQALGTDSAWVDYWVLGSFTSPNFLADKDGRATPLYPDDNDESFDIATKGADATRAPGRVTFICSIPRTTAEHKPPFPVMTYGHGYSGAPFEVFGFAGRFAQFGYAFCGLDAPGHGLALPADESIDYQGLVTMATQSLGLYRFYTEFEGGRIRDLDNDGKATAFDNGGDFWSWDLFHLRDIVRQLVIDHMQWIRVLRSLGTTRWEADTNGNGKADDLAGDFNGDGVVDLGTPVNRYYPTWGQSMGAIGTQVLAAVEPTVAAAMPIAGGGGLIHVGLRTVNPGVPEAVMMPLMGPFVTFSPLGDADDTVEIAWVINHLHREYPKTELGLGQDPKDPERPHYYPFTRTTEIEPGDTVIVRNLDNGEEIRAFRHPDGRGFRVSVPADALAAVEKRALLGLHDGDTQPVPVSCDPVTDPRTVKVGEAGTDDEGKPIGIADCKNPDLARSMRFGDAIEIEVRDGKTGEFKRRFQEFDIPVTYEGAHYPVGAKLVAIATGLGRARNTPDFRKLLTLAAMIVEPGDPIGYARHYAKDERLDFGYDPDAAPQANVIIYHAIGDPNVTVSTSLALARAAGVLAYLPTADAPDAKTPNDLLLEAHVSEGCELFGRHASSTLTLQDWKDNDTSLLTDPRWPAEFAPEYAADPTQPMPLHADPDDLDDGTNEFGEPSVPGYSRATRHNDAGYIALRLPYTYPLGAHGVEPSNPTRKFNINNFVENQIAVFAASDGKVLSDDPCLADSSCDFLPESVRKKAKP